MAECDGKTEIRIEERGDGVVAAKKPNWNAIKAEYAKGGISYRDLAEKHGVSFPTLRDRAKRESWTAVTLQIRDKVVTEFPDKMTAIVLDEAGDWVRETLKSAKMLKRKFDESIYADRKHVANTKEGPILIDIPLLNTAQDLKALADSLASIDKIARLSLRLDERKDDTGAMEWGSDVEELEKRTAIQTPSENPPLAE